MDMFSGRMLRRETKTLERVNPGKRVKPAGSQGECALIRVRGVLLFAYNLSMIGSW